MRILLPCCLMLLSGCTSITAQPSEALFQVQPWPQPVNIEKQSGVAKYITRGKAAYDSCTVNVQELRKIMRPDAK
jgi:outer membrane biogenesis lipoprotein LolB